MLRASPGDLYSMMLCPRKKVPISFLTVSPGDFFMTSRSTCKGFLPRLCSLSYSRPSLFSRSSSSTAEQKAGCHCTLFSISNLFTVRNGVPYPFRFLFLIVLLSFAGIAMVYRDSIARCGFFMIPNSSIAWGIVMRNTAKTRKGKPATGIQNSVFGKR